MCVARVHPTRIDAHADESLAPAVAFKVYDMDRDGFISNGELFLVLKMMVGNNLKVRTSFLPSLVDPSSAQRLTWRGAIVQDQQLQQIVDKSQSPSLSRPRPLAIGTSCRVSLPRGD